MNLKILISSLFIFVMILGGGGKTKTTKGSEPLCEVILKPSAIFLNQIFIRPPGRNANSQVPAFPNLWSGAPSASNLFGNNTQYYCVITVTSNCGNYRQVVVWNTSQTPQNDRMIVNLPTNVEFRITVDYWEQCGPFWLENGNDFTFKRGVWIANYSGRYRGVITIGDWAFARAENC